MAVGFSPNPSSRPIRGSNSTVIPAEGLVFQVQLVSVPLEAAVLVVDALGAHEAPPLQDAGSDC